MENTNASKIIDQMMSKDLFSQWMRIERVEERAGFCRLKMVIKEEMCNGFEIAHGGIIYSIADSALAFASNSRGKKAVSLDTSMTYIKPVKPGEVVYALRKSGALATRWRFMKSGSRMKAATL